MNIVSILKDIIAPKKCYFCRSEGHFFCPSCQKKTQKIPEICYVCKNISSGFVIHDHCRQELNIDSLMVLFSYKDVKKIIKDSKYYAKKDILEDLGTCAGEYLLKNLSIENTQEYIILPISMNFWRKSKRGYNHADILASYASKVSGIFYHTTVVKRTKNTIQQSKLSKKERLSNLAGAFKLQEKHTHLIRGKKVILIDDVVSTGVTFSEVATVVRDAGASRIDCIAIASDTRFFDEKE